ncbi:MAG: hypothetical protein KatS3mg111_2733 [Pirellulaceae bacterium]|nr:MAG: hypothetical protein KatS3mg111_2733 [Pirellulaceae bacterium]
MKKRNGNLFQRMISRSGMDHQPVQHPKRLAIESLEGRRLLSADGLAYYHNSIYPADVNRDFNVTPLDALITINALNRGHGGQLVGQSSPSNHRAMFDVNGDNYLSAIDALMVINLLNAEGEHAGQPDVAEFRYEFVDLNGQPIPNNQVVVGQQFQLVTYIRDVRGFQAQGISAAYLDIDFDNSAAFDVAAGEIQTLKFFIDTIDSSNTSSSFTLSLGGETSGPIGLFTSGGSPRSVGAVATAMQSALEAMSSIGAGNVEVIVDQTAMNEDRENNIFTRYNFEIRFKGALAGQDLPLLVPDSSNVVTTNGQPLQITVAEVVEGDVPVRDLQLELQSLEGIPVGDRTPEQEQRITELKNLLSFLGSKITEFGDLYDFAREATLTVNAFDEIGAASQTLPFPDPSEFKLLFSIPMFARAPGVITFTPNPADDSPLHDMIAIMPDATDPLDPFGRLTPEQVIYGDPFSITVIQDPTSPVAINDTLTIAEDTSITLDGNVTVNDQVTAPRTLSIQSVTAVNVPVGSTLVGTTFTPPADFFGQAVLAYVAVDSTGLTSNEATVTINITPVNDAPVAIDDSFTVTENSTASDLDNRLEVLTNDNGGPNEGTDGIRVVSVGSTAQGGTVTITADGQAIIYVPPADFIGQDTFSYTIEDAGGLQATAIVTVTVEPGVLPRARTDVASGVEGQPIFNIDVLANDRVHPGAAATLLSVNDGTHGTVTIDDNGTPTDLTDDTVTYTPNDPDFFGSDQFTYVMNDTAQQGQDSVGTVLVTITNVNDPPELADDAASTDEDMALTIPIATLLSNDSPGAGEGPGSAAPQTLTLTSVNALTAGGGSVAIQGSNVVYTPAANFNGIFEFEYTATDNGDPPLSSTATVVITVNAVNDDPIANPDSLDAVEDTAAAFDVSLLLANDLAGPPDEQGTQTLSVTGVSAVSSSGATVALTGTTISYTPPADYFGTDTFTYTLSDGAGGTATGTVTVQVAPINDAPVAGDDNLVAFVDRTRIITSAELLANDLPGPANESDQSLTIVSVTPGADIHGTVVLNADGTISYTPDPGYIGPASFQYTVEDSGPSGNGHQNSTVGTVHIEVKPFIPADISGTVWVDETNDGVIDAAERRLGGIIVTISGSALGEPIAPVSVMTLADGSYRFPEMPPGEYVVKMTPPPHFLDGLDVPGPLGDADLIANQFTIRIPEPGGGDASGYNFAVRGVDAFTANKLASIQAAILQRDPSAVNQGFYVAVGDNNSLLWTAMLDGFQHSMFTEAVLSSDGNSLVISYVNNNHDVFSAFLGRRDFMKTTDASGNTIVRVFGDMDDFEFQQIDLDNPPVSAHENYLAAIDSIFDQEAWSR